jgi:hypothetical protein
MARVNWRTIQAPKLTAEQVAVKLYDAAKGKAASRGLTFGLDFNDVLRRVQAGRCELTGIAFDMRQKPHGGMDFPFRASLDRIDNTIGYETGNIQVVCRMYNTAKYMWEDRDVMRMALKLVEKRYGKVQMVPPPVNPP